jgi:uncharacterized protein YciI
MKPNPENRYVVLHKPGPNWKHELPFFAQPGLQGHVDHYRKLLHAGKLSMGGPFMDEASGGMVITELGIAEAEVRQFAAEDPTVQSGLLTFEVRPWFPAMHR